MNLNVKSIFYLTAALTPPLTKDTTNLAPGRVINISSIASLSPRTEGNKLAGEGDGLYSYNVSKACVDTVYHENTLRLISYFSAVNHLTQIQAVSLAPKHVTVNAILPGVFPSKMSAYGIRTAGAEMARAQPTGALLVFTFLGQCRHISK